MFNKLITSLHRHDFPVKFENRNSSRSWLYNGNSIALKCDYGRYLDHDNIHEIGHYVAAHPDQRLFPEFGLAFGIAEANAWGKVGEGYRLKDGNLDYDAILYLDDGLIPKEEQEIQEFLAQKIAIYFGKTLNFSAKLLHERPGPWDTWEGYISMKKNELRKQSKQFQKEVHHRFKNLLPILRSVVYAAYSK